MKKLFLAAAIVVSANVFAQQLTSQPTFQKSQKLEMTVQVTNSMDLGMGTLDIKGTILRIFDVENASVGNTVIEHKIKRLQATFDLPAMGGQSFDSEKESDMQSPIGKSLGKYVKNKYTMTLDASGRVASVKADDDNPNGKPVKDDQAEMINGLLSQITEGLGLPNAGDRTEFSVLPARALSKGDSWTDSTSIRKTVYTLTNFTDSEIFVSFTEDGVTKKDLPFGPATMKLDLRDKTSGTLTLDRNTGLLKQKSSTTTSEGTMEAMGQQGPISSKTTKTWTIK